jgi:hypothetical protein
MKIPTFARVAGLLFGLSLTAGSQQPKVQRDFPANKEAGGLSGRVFDRNGAVIVGAQVLVLGNAKARFAAMTNGEGVYKVGLPPGFYNIDVSANGFSKFELGCYQIPSSNSVTLDVTLTVSGERGCTLEPPQRRRSPSRQKSKRSMKPIIAG